MMEPNKTLTLRVEADAGCSIEDCSHQTSQPVEGPLEPSVVPLPPERTRTCEQGCNGCDECTDYWDGDDGPERDLTCRHCSGTGGDPWNDGITPCEHCDGEGYEWWN